MELLQLKYFCDAARSENFSKTARKYGVPASDISQTVKRLEAELGCALFVRAANRIRLSDEGKDFYEKVSRGLALINEGVLAAENRKSRPRLRILATINRRIIVETAEEYRRRYPAVDLSISYGIQENPADGDLIIADRDLKKEGFPGERLFSEEILLAVKKDNPLAEKEKITPDELCRQPFITMSRGESQQLLTESICADMGFSPRVAIEGSDPFYIRRCVEMGLGVTFCPEFSWKGQFSDEVALKRVGDYRRETWLCRNPLYGKSPAAEDFKALLFEICRKEK